ncbi:prolyl oligopeptidase family serine peptidase [Luteimonas sp. MC1825]|uniref:alpha/beta hydrolase family protein n=1 Tax=Luteimonas sp. MC1825 TaxID=2761107 RepID=UPI0016225D4E|nr:prolyl oligopeptidase family serine peptidase [Luteimonas sp. MC1825]MBB6598641.1 S9 family peptidase [Luteimonas sp. MC1825]QOC88816.1 S9 family peptidase [Luteimonas sp. MC1825]
MLIRTTRAACIAGLLAISLLAATATTPAQATEVDVAAYVKRDLFTTIKISPNGDYFAATLPFEDRVALVIMDRVTRQVMGTFQMGRDTAVADFDWVSPDRVLISAAQKIGFLAEPQPTGDLYGMDASGGRVELLVGQSVGGNLGSRMQGKRAERVAAFLVDDLPNDDKHVLISVMPFTADPYTRVERMNVYTGVRHIVTRVPVRNARFASDNQGVVRFALGGNTDNISQLFYRDGDASEWKQVNHEAASGRIEVPIGFSADDKTAYLLVEQSSGPDVVVAYDPATGKHTELLRDETMDPTIIYKPGTSIPVGAMYGGDKPRFRFFDETSADARLYRSLQGAFGGDAAVITSSTRDGRVNLVHAWSDRNPGDFFLFDAEAKKADYVISAAEWFNPAGMAAVRPIELAARDGLKLKGFLTVPKGASGKQMPMVVLPHGGPFNVSDEWGFNREAQMLAAAGYAVLQVNFRGSGGRGRRFHQAGAQQWGLAMQDDVSDATRWAIREGFADPARICIYGASYGAFAAMSGAAREPDLYKCAAGFIGVYDLPQLHQEEVLKHGSMRTWANEWIGSDKATLQANSPTRRAGSIKVPVLLAAGREDKTAPVEHTQNMERALKTAGVPVEAHYYASEGHGFYKPENNRDYYTKLLDFLSRHLGGSKATVAAGER